MARRPSERSIYEQWCAHHALLWPTDFHDEDKSYIFLPRAMARIWRSLRTQTADIDLIALTMASAGVTGSLRFAVVTTEGVTDIKRFYWLPRLEEPTRPWLASFLEDGKFRGQAEDDCEGWVFVEASSLETYIAGIDRSGIKLLKTSTANGQKPSTTIFRQTDMIHVLADVSALISTPLPTKEAVLWMAEEAYAKRFPDEYSRLPKRGVEPRKRQNGDQAWTGKLSEAAVTSVWNMIAGYAGDARAGKRKKSREAAASTSTEA